MSQGCLLQLLPKTSTTHRAQAMMRNVGVRRARRQRSQ
jgi:hypothetical protein